MLATAVVGRKNMGSWTYYILLGLRIWAYYFTSSNSVHSFQFRNDDDSDDK